jgi:photosystem II stability/assembly factor-like uncharacterized protein
MKCSRIFNITLCIIISFIGCENNENPVSDNNKSGEWNIISSLNDNINKIYFIDSRNGWAVGDSGSINYTSDGGHTWTKQNSRTDNKLTSIYFIDDQKGFACGYNNTLIYTEDKGNTWMQIQVISDSGLIYSSINTDNNGNLYFISNYGEIYCSNDNGLTWNNKYNLDNWGYYLLDNSNSPTCYAMQYGFNSLYKSTDDGNSWVIKALPVNWSGDIYILDTDYIWITENWAPSSSWHDSVSIHMSNDGGNTWSKQSTLLGYKLENVVFIDTIHGWVSQITKIYFTSDSGKSWTCQFESDEVGYIRDIFFLDSNNGWAITSEGKIIKYNEK